MSSSFSLSHVEDNKEGWGPSSIPEKFTAVPFLPYGKGERLGRIADFGYSSHSRMGHYSGTYSDCRRLRWSDGDCRSFFTRGFYSRIPYCLVR